MAKSPTRSDSGGDSAHLQGSTRPARSGPRRLLLASPLLLLACNQYEYFNLAGYEQASFSNDADILFVIDNSPSMQDESADLGLNFNVFIETLTNPEEGAEQVTESLSDAVGNYLDYTAQRGRFLDYQLGITTTTVDYSAEGATNGVDPGEAGRLLGSPEVVVKSSANVADQFQGNLMCEATCWDADEVPADADYQCGDELDGSVSLEFLDCVCGGDSWEDDENCGTGNEEHLEAALLALCRSVEDPPEVCYEYGSGTATAFAESDDLKNADFLREGSTVVVVFATDEGDNSRRMAQGESDPTVYTEAFDEFDLNIKFVAIGPPWHPDEGSFTCNSGNATTWGTERLQYLAEYSGGFYRDISQDGADGDCEVADFATYLEDLGQLLANLQTAFQLQSIPDVTTIRVYVDGKEAPAAWSTEGVDEAELVAQGCDLDSEYCAGWTYDSAQNAVQFWEPAVPGYNADVRIYYRPLDGKPREIPF